MKYLLELERVAVVYEWVGARLVEIGWVSVLRSMVGGT